jgi:hypothetical protein
VAEDPTLSVLLEDLRIAWEDWHSAEKAQTQVVAIVAAAIAATFAGIHWVENSVVLCSAAVMVFAVLGLALTSYHIRTNYCCLYVRCDLIPRLTLYCPGALGYIDRGITFPRTYGESDSRAGATGTLFIAGIWAIVVVPGMTALSAMLYYVGIAPELGGAEKLLAAAAAVVTGLVLVPALAAVVPQAWAVYSRWERGPDGTVQPVLSLSRQACSIVALLLGVAVLLVAVPQWTFTPWTWSRLWTANSLNPWPWLATQLSLYALVALALAAWRVQSEAVRRGVLIASVCVAAAAFVSWVVVVALG